MIKVKSEADKVCVAKAQESGQGHLFERWDELSQEDQRGLLRDLRSVNFQLVKRLLHQRRQGQDSGLELDMLAPAQVEGPADANGTQLEGACPNAEAALSEGKIALFLLAAGKLPHPAQQPFGRPLRNKQIIALPNNAGGDLVVGFLFLGCFERQGRGIV